MPKAPLDYFFLVLPKVNIYIHVQLRKNSNERIDGGNI